MAETEGGRDGDGRAATTTIGNTTIGSRARPQLAQLGLCSALRFLSRGHLGFGGRQG